MLPKTGKDLPRQRGDMSFAKLVSTALVGELGQTHRAVKTAMRWTGASERCVKHWLAGRHAPRGAHLIGLIRHSDGVLRDLLIAAERHDAAIGLELSLFRNQLRDLLALIDGYYAAPIDA